MGTVVRLPVVDEGLPRRPATRGDCVDVPRPCPFVSCKFNLFLSVDKERRGRARDAKVQKDRLVFETAHECPSEMAPEVSCVLDVADRGPLTLDDIGGVLAGVTRERVRQIEASALAQLRSNEALVEIHEDGFDHEHDDDDSDDAEGEGGAKGAFVGFKDADDLDARRRDVARRAYERALVARGLTTWRTHKGQEDDGTTRLDRAGEAARTPNVWTKNDQEELEAWLDGRALDANDNRIEWPARIATHFDGIAKTLEGDQRDAMTPVAYVTPTSRAPEASSEARNYSGAAERSPVRAVEQVGELADVSGQRDLSPGGGSDRARHSSKRHVARIGEGNNDARADVILRAEGMHAGSAVAPQQCSTGDASRGDAPERNGLPDAVVSHSRFDALGALAEQTFARSGLPLETSDDTEVVEDVMTRPSKPRTYEQLTQRQRTIIDAYNEDPSPARVAERLGMSATAVATVINTFRPLGLITGRARGPFKPAPVTLAGLRSELVAMDERRPKVVAAIAALEALQEGVRS